jgi:mRNA interferase RelE/StbE
VSGTPWRVRVMAPALRQLERTPERYAAAILELLPAIATDPKRVGKPLRLEWEGHRVARRGPYRVIYALDTKTRTVRVVAVAHRADVYRPR